MVTLGSLHENWSHALLSDQFAHSLALQNAGEVQSGRSLTISQKWMTSRAASQVSQGSRSSGVRFALGQFLSSIHTRQKENLISSLLLSSSSDHADQPDKKTTDGIEPTGVNAIISITPISVIEGDEGTREAIFTVNLSQPSAEVITVDYATIDYVPSLDVAIPDFIALPGRDYISTQGTLIFNPNETGQTITVPILGDNVIEMNELFTVQLSNPSHAELELSGGLVTIKNDDYPRISINDASVNEGNSGTNVLGGYDNQIVLTVTLSEATLNETVTVSYSTTTDTATNNDYAYYASGVLHFRPGEVSKTIAINVEGDTVLEPNQQFLINLSDPKNAEIIDTQGVGTILDDDPIPSIRIINDVSIYEGNFGDRRNATFQVALSNASEAPISVEYTTVDETAIAGQDYTAAAGTLTFAPGETLKTIAVPLLVDSRNEADERFTLQLTNATLEEIKTKAPPTIIGSSGIATVKTDDQPTITLSGFSASEASRATFSVNLSRRSDVPVSVDYQTIDGEAIAGQDYEFTQGTLTFAPGEYRKTIVVPLINDSLEETSEKFSLMLTNPASGVLNGNRGVFTIHNDDDDRNPNTSPPARSRSIRVTNATGLGQRTIYEAGQTAVFTVQLNAISEEPITVEYFTLDGTARAGEDYQEAHGTLTFAPGERFKTVEVPILDNTSAESTEVFTLNLHNSSNAYLLDLTYPIEARIMDDDQTTWLDGISTAVQVAMSANGRFVAFTSDRALTPDDSNTHSDVYLYDRESGTTKKVSRTGGRALAISSDGRYVVSGFNHEITLYDRETEQITPLLEINQVDAHDLSISADGRYIAFASRSSTLVTGDSNSVNDVFLYDRQTGQTQLISRSTNGINTGNRDSRSTSISADGRYLTFSSLANDLVSGDTNLASDVFLYDQQTATTRIISLTPQGESTNPFGSSYAPSISADGRYIAFTSNAENLVAHDTNNTSDVFVYDQQTGVIAAVSITADGNLGNASSESASISADGRYVTFVSSATNLVGRELNSGTEPDVFVYDRTTRHMTRISATDGTAANNRSSSPVISADGNSVAFHSYATNLGAEQAGLVLRRLEHPILPADHETLGTIMIESKHVAAGFEHLYLVYRDHQGRETVIRSGPEVDIPAFWGQIVVEADLPLDRSEDRRFNGDIRLTPDQRQSRVLDLNGRRAADVWAIMLQQASNIHSAKLNYFLLEQNCNSTIASVLQAVGIDINTTCPVDRDADYFPAMNNPLTLNTQLAGTFAADIIVGGLGNDFLSGGSGDDRLQGENGTDQLEGGAGNDRLTGGQGTDMAIYSGNFAEYSISTSEDGTTITVAHVGGNQVDGIDQLEGIERLKFHDRTLWL